MTSPTALPEGLRARAPRPDDLTAVVQLMVEDETLERGEPDTSHADIEADWSRPSFDLATQALVVVDQVATVVAYAELLHMRSQVYVAPSHHGLGLGGALLDWCEDLARERGDAHLGQTVFDGNAAAIALHRERDYRVRWETWLFSRDLPGEPPPPPPVGYRVRPIDLARDDRDVHRVIEVAFSTFDERDPSTFEDWRATYWEHEDISPTFCNVVEDAEGEIVAALLGLLDDGVGVVDQLGVLPEVHGRGLGRLLLLTAFATFAEHGATSVVLSTESRGRARGFYERAGMTLLRSFTRFVKDL